MAYFKRLRLLSSFVLFSVCTSGHAGGLEPIQEWCVTNSTQLQTALTAAETNDSGDLIKIATGTYQVPVGGFRYDAASPANGDGFSLTLSGGWTEFFDNPCGQQLSQNPLLTILDGGGTSRVLRITVRPTSNVTVRLLGIFNGNGGSGGGLLVDHDFSQDYSGVIQIERNAFINNEAAFNGGLKAVFEATGNARLGLVNNVFSANKAQTNWGAGTIHLNGGNSGISGAGIRAVNNTVINNTVIDEPLNVGGLRIGGTAPTKYVVNNIFWGNQAVDLELFAQFDSIRLHNNNIGVRIGAEPSVQSGNLSIEPVWEPCFLCFAWVPLASSPLVDGGIHPPFISPFWFLTQLDLRGNPRIHNGTVDIGAYESYERMFSDRFESN